MDVYTAASRIAGTGCFAARDFKKGELIGEYTGERISADEASERYADTTVTYLFALEDGTHIDARPVDNPVKYINHACDPNCESDEEEGRIFIRTIRPIRKDEELTMDYNLEVDESERDLHPCNCGAAGCRGTQVRPS